MYLAHMHSNNYSYLISHTHTVYGTRTDVVPCPLLSSWQLESDPASVETSQVTLPSLPTISREIGSSPRCVLTYLLRYSSQTSNLLPTEIERVDQSTVNNGNRELISACL